MERVEPRLLLADTGVAFIAGPESAVAGVPVVVTVGVYSPADGGVDPTATNLITIAIEPTYTGGTSGVAQSQAAVAGVATFDDLRLPTQATRYTLFASAPGITGQGELSVPVLPAAPAALAFAYVPTTADAGQSVGEYSSSAYHAAEVDVSDAFGNVTLNAATTVTVSTTAGDTVAATGDGQISLTALRVTHAGAAQVFTATAPGLPPATSTAFTVVPAATVGFLFASEPADLTAGQSLPAGLINTVDAYGNVTTDFDGAPVSVALVEGGQTDTAQAAAVVDGTVVLPAGFTPTASGTYQLQVNDARYSLQGGTPAAVDGGPAIASVASAAFAVATGPAVQVVVSGQAASFLTLVGQTFGPLTFAIEDAYGNTVDGNAGAVISVAATGASLAGTTSEPVTGGTATFADLSIATAGTYALTATLADGPGPALPPATASVAVRPPLLTSTTTAAGRSIGTLTVDVAAYLPSLPSDAAATGRLSVEITDELNLASRPLDRFAPIRHGIARLRLPALRVASLYTISLDGAAVDVAGTTFTVTPAAPVRLAFYQDVDQATDGTLSVGLTLFDRFGNQASNAAGTLVTLAYAGPAVDGRKPMLGGTVTAAVEGNGTVGFTGLTLPTLRHARLVATAHGLPPALSAAFPTG